MEKPSYYAILTADVRYSKDINANEKLLYAEITALSNSTGVCWASNGYFSELFDVTPQAISKWVKNLERQNFISCTYTYKQGSKEIESRIISINKTTEEGINDGLGGINNGIKGINHGLGGYQHTVKDNNTSTNNIYTNTSKEKPQKYPSLDEFISYALDVDSGLSKKALEDTYNLWSCNNWVDGKGKKISNWKMKLKNKIVYLPKGLTKDEEGFLQSFNNNLKKANIDFEYDDFKKQESKEFLQVVLSEYRDKMGGVLKLMINDKWHKENNYVYLTPDHYLKKQNFMKYLTKPSVYLPDDWKVRKLTNEQLQYVIDNIDPNYQDKYRRALIMGGIYKETKIK